MSRKIWKPSKAEPGPVTPAEPILSKVFVATTGDDATGDGSEQKPWRHIQYAVDNAPELFVEAPTKTEVWIAPGVYEEAPVVKRSIALRNYSAAPGDVVIKSPGEAYSWSLLVKGDVDVELRGLTIDCTPAGAVWTRGIYVFDSRVRISTSTIRMPQMCGIWIENSPEFLVLQCVISTEGANWSDVAIVTVESKGLIRQLTAGDHFDHIVTIVGEESDVTVEDCVLTGSPIHYADGIRMSTPMGNATFSGNVVTRPAGSEPWDAGGTWEPPYGGIQVASDVDSDKRVDVIGNTVSGFDIGLGIYCNGNGVMAEGNTLSDNVRYQVHVAEKGFWKPTTIDLGGGALGSKGGNKLLGGQYALYHEGAGDITAKGNDWGGASATRIRDKADDPALGKVTT